jgi:toxin-antitoxin system PIN domain toxin
MTRYSKSSLFPDLNVWVALTYTKHTHYECAHRWYLDLPDDAQLLFCRFTQIGFLRLITTTAVMGDEVLDQAAAWRLYDEWLGEGGAECVEEPAGVERVFRSMSRSNYIAPKNWADAYLAAFATVSDMQFVTFDQGFQGKVEKLLILTPQFRTT